MIFVILNKDGTSRNLYIFKYLNSQKDVGEPLFKQDLLVWLEGSTLEERNPPTGTWKIAYNPYYPLELGLPSVNKAARLNIQGTYAGGGSGPQRWTFVFDFKGREPFIELKLVSNDIAYTSPGKIDMRDYSYTYVTEYNILGIPTGFKSINTTVEISPIKHSLFVSKPKYIKPVQQMYKTRQIMIRGRTCCSCSRCRLNRLRAVAKFY